MYGFFPLILPISTHIISPSARNKYMSRSLKEAGYSIRQLNQRAEQLEAKRENFSNHVKHGGREMFLKRLDRAREKGAADFAETVLEVGERRVVVLGIINNISNGAINERLIKIEDIINNHPATGKIRRIETLQALGHIDEVDAVPAIDYLNDWVPDAPQEENPEPEEKILDAGAPVSVGRPEPDIRLNPEDKRIAELKAEFRTKLESVKISPIPKKLIEALINGGYFDESNLMQRRELALAVYPDKSPEESLGALSFQTDAAKKAIAGVLSLEGKRAKGADTGGYFLRFSHPS